jgi:hypothetical protein
MEGIRNRRRAIKTRRHFECSYGEREILKSVYESVVKSPPIQARSEQLGSDSHTRNRTADSFRRRTNT